MIGIDAEFAQLILVVLHLEVGEFQPVRRRDHDYPAVAFYFPCRDQLGQSRQCDPGMRTGE